MKASDYRKIENSELLNVLLSVCNGPDFNPGRRALRAQLVEALPDADVKVIDALMTKCEGYAREAVDHEARFDLRARARELCLHVVKSLEAQDRLIPADDDDEVDTKAALEYIDSYDRNPFESPAFKAAAREADIETARKLAGS